MLKNQLAKATKLGYRMKTGVEAEFFLLTPDGGELSDPLDTQGKPCYDQSALMRRYDVITEICDSMTALGWGPYQNDHEDANGQFEMNWDYDDALMTADRHVFFKFMTRTIAESHGVRATFMPNSIAYGGNNRSTMLRIPDAGRIALRLMDGAANPYLLQAGILVAGLDGIKNKRDPGKRIDLNLYAEGHKVRGLRKLPLNLLDAIRLTEKDKVLRDGFGESFIASYAKLKSSQWNDYAGSLSQWERDNTLDC